MAIVFKTPTDVANEYLAELKGLKPELNTDQTDNDWYIRSRVIGGVAAGIYADQRQLANDPFPQRARRDAIAKHLETYFEAPDNQFKPATQANGVVMVSGDIGATVPAGMQFLYAPNGNAYQTTESIVLEAPTGAVEAISVAAGQNQNLLAGATLQVTSPPAGIESSATVLEDFADAREAETTSEAAQRVLDRIRQPLSVGRESDYIQYAREADPSVVSASVRRYPFGLGTVAVYITSGTTDIDAAVDSGTDVTIIPSDQLVETVQDYLESNKPITDCVTVLKPTPLEIDVTVRVRLKQGDLDTILSGQTITQRALIQREVKRALYKTPVGGYVFDDVGYIVNSVIEETIDVGLSASPETVGKLAILLDRQVDDLAASGANRMILPNEAPIPGTITVVEM